MHTCVCFSASARQSDPQTEPKSLDRHIAPPAGTQLYSVHKHLIQASHSLSDPGHIALPQAEVLRHRPYNLEATLMCLPSTCSPFPPRRTLTCYLMREELCVGGRWLPALRTFTTPLPVLICIVLLGLWCLSELLTFTTTSHYCSVSTCVIM